MAWHGPFMIEKILVSLQSVLSQLFTKKGFFDKETTHFSDNNRNTVFFMFRKSSRQRQ